MPQSYRKKPLAAWPENKKHGEVRSPENIGETSASGHMPEPEADDDVEQLVKDMGLYIETDPEVGDFEPENIHKADITKEADKLKKKRS